MPDPIYFAQALRHPDKLDPQQLVEMTRDLHTTSAISTQRSPVHQWYYRLANECERRGYNLTHILKGKK
jgi:hypothetical protein